MADHDLISAAAATLAALRGALPEHIQRPWRSFLDQIYVEINGHDHVFVWADTNRTTGAAGNSETSAHIAHTSSPDVVEAMEGLLRALSNCVWREETNGKLVLPPLIRLRAQRLAAAIERRPIGLQEANE